MWKTPNLPPPSPPEPISEPCHRQRHRQNESQPRSEVTPHGRTAGRATRRKAGRKRMVPWVEVGVDAEVPDKYVGRPAVSSTNAEVGTTVPSHPRNQGPVWTGADERFIPAGPSTNARPAEHFRTQFNVLERVVVYPCPLARPERSTHGCHAQQQRGQQRQHGRGSEQPADHAFAPTGIGVPHSGQHSLLARKSKSHTMQRPARRRTVWRRHSHAVQRNQHKGSPSEIATTGPQRTEWLTAGGCPRPTIRSAISWPLS